MTMNEMEIDVLMLKKAAIVLRAINHPLRRGMLAVIHQKKQSTVTELYKTLQLEQSVASQHLAILRSAGYVITERQGKFIFYSVNYERLKEVHHYSGELILS